MSKPVTAIIVGAGHRSLVYARYAVSNPDRLKIVGVADPDGERRLMAQKLFNLPEDMLFESAEALAKKGKLADAVINGTMDQQHVATAVPLLEAGYDMLLEKPFAISEAELRALIGTARRCGRKVMVCHVLRYAPFYAEIKKRLPRLGKIQGIDWRRCDYIYVSDGIRVRDFVTHDDKRPGTDRYPTDHYPLSATIEL